MATSTKTKYHCMQCDMTEDKCDCEKYCCSCQGQIDVRLCSDGLYYCPPCAKRAAIGFLTRSSRPVALHPPRATNQLSSSGNIGLYSDLMKTRPYPNPCRSNIPFADGEKLD